MKLTISARPMPRYGVQQTEAQHNAGVAKQLRRIARKKNKQAK
jgi:hypothetical protein